MSGLAVDVLTAIYAAGGTVRIAGEDRLKVQRTASAAQCADGSTSCREARRHVVAVRRSRRLDRRCRKSGR